MRWGLTEILKVVLSSWERKEQKKIQILSSLYIEILKSIQSDDLNTKLAFLLLESICSSASEIKILSYGTLIKTSNSTKCHLRTDATRFLPILGSGLNDEYTLPSVDKLMYEMNWYCWVSAIITLSKFAWIAKPDQEVLRVYLDKMIDWIQSTQEYSSYISAFATFFVRNFSLNEMDCLHLIYYKLVNSIEKATSFEL